MKISKKQKKTPEDIITGFDLSFQRVVVKICPFATLCWVNKDENIAQQILTGYPSPQDNIYQYSQLLKTNLLPETNISQAQHTFICLNSAILTVE